LDPAYLHSKELRPISSPDEAFPSLSIDSHLESGQQGRYQEPNLFAIDHSHFRMDSAPSVATLEGSIDNITLDSEHQLPTFILLRAHLELLPTIY
jgi:hypothetical protein